MAEGTIRYWAAARAAAGVESEPFAADTLAEALAGAAARHGPELARVLTACSFLIDEDPVGKRDHASVPLHNGAVIEALPPFAGGAA
jgi:hypothetical protein